MLWGCATRERLDKSTTVIKALLRGWPEPSTFVIGPPPNNADPFVAWGQVWLAAEIIPPAIAAGRPFWHIDNGYWSPPVNGFNGYHRICYRGMTPINWVSAPTDRCASITMKPWRKTGKHILLAMPTGNFGKAVGVNYDGWFENIQQRIRAATDRPIVVRNKGAINSIQADLVDCWALVTHSSNAAVDAVLAGIPAFVEPSSPTASLGNIGVDGIEHPAMPSRAAWLASLSCQQFTQPEMINGTAWHYLREVRRMADNGGPRPVQSQPSQVA